MSESNDDLYTALKQGKVDSVIDDSPIARYFSESLPGLRVAGILPKTEGAYAIMLRKGNTRLRDELNRLLDEMEREGSIRRLVQQWLGDSVQAVSK